MRFSVVAALAFASILVFGQSSSPEAVEKATFGAICGTCHSTDLVDGLRTEQEWREEIDQMIKVGARGTSEQFERIMRYLARTLTIVNVNTADARQIAPVLDVSESVAETVVKRRNTNGKFKNLQELKQVPGLDPAKLDDRKDRIEF
jgi:competence protein ComEA